MPFKINDNVLYEGIKAKITAVLSENRYQVYTQKGEIKLAYESELVKCENG